jgi:glycosyltransferase involved in cell wall biosynthesis
MTPRKGPLVSVVTPVYNGEEYIAECIESVLRQTHRHFEYLVVDNCSTDSTPEIVASYADRDPRIRLLRPAEFVGPDPNANRALREISQKSAYTKVLHADDWLFPDCLERMVARAVANPNVGIVGAYRLEGSKVTLDGLPITSAVVPGRDICRAQLLGRPWGYLIGSPSSVLYRSDLVRARPEFYRLDNPITSDKEVFYRLLQESDFGFVHQVLTYTRRHDEADSVFHFRIGAGQPGDLNLLIKYGRVFLSEDEYRRRLAARVFDYARLLGFHAILFRHAEFREFHAAALGALRGSIPPREVVDGVVRAVEQRLRRSGS